MQPTKNLAIVFDFGGVLIDWNPRYLYRKLFDGDEAAMERFLAEIRFMDWNVKQDNGRPFDEAVAELSAQFPQYAALIRAYHERYPESISGPIAPTVALLKALKAAGYPLYGLSNWPLEKFLLVRPRYDFFNWFDDMVISGEVKLIKPDPRIFALLLERIGRPAAQCLLIDDSEKNIEAARRLGFQTIHFESPEQCEAALITLGLLPQASARG